MRKIHHSKKITILYDHMSIGNHLYCYRFYFTITNTFLSEENFNYWWQPKHLLQITMQYMDYSDGKKLSNIWKIRAWIPLSKFYHFRWLRSNANIIYWEGSNCIMNTFFFFLNKYLWWLKCSSQIQTQSEKLKN